MVDGDGHWGLFTDLRGLNRECHECPCSYRAFSAHATRRGGGRRLPRSHRPRPQKGHMCERRPQSFKTGTTTESAPHLDTVSPGRARTGNDGGQK